MLNSTNLLTQKINNFTPVLQANKEESSTSSPKPEMAKQGLISAYLDNLARINAPKVTQISKAEAVNYHNNLKTLFNNNEAKILAIIPRVFNAKDTNGNEYIDGNEQ